MSLRLAKLLSEWEIVEHSATHPARPYVTTGEGPPVLLLHSVPGVTPDHLEFGRDLANEGMTVVVPSIFGELGREVSTSYSLREIARLSTGTLYSALGEGPGQVVEWLGGLVNEICDRHNADQIAVIGEGVSGNLPLFLLRDERVVAPVLANPAFPLTVGAKRRRSVGLSEHDWPPVQRRVATGTQVLGFRFTNDSLVPDERFDTLRANLGDDFIAVEVDPRELEVSLTNAHSIVADHVPDQPSHPVSLARDSIIEFVQVGLGKKAAPARQNIWSEIQESTNVARRENKGRDIDASASVEVFISYASQDATYVEGLVSELETFGISVWFDRELRAGSAWLKELGDRIASSAALVVVVSEASNDSHWVETEIIHALDLNKPIFPVVLSDSLPFYLRRFQAVVVDGAAMPGTQLADPLRRALSASAAAG